MPAVSNHVLRAWALGLALLSLVAGLTRPGDSGNAMTGAAVALLMLAAALAGRALASVGLHQPAHIARAVTMRDHARRVGALRHSHPDAAGHARPRAPGSAPAA